MANKPPLIVAALVAVLAVLLAAHWRWQLDGPNMRLEDRNLCVTGTELSCISELKDDGGAFLARYPDRTYVPRSRMRLGLIPNPALDIIAPWRRWLCGLTIVVEPVPFPAPVNQPG